MAGITDLAVEQLKRYSDLKSERDGIWQPGWQILSDYYLPEMSDINTDKSEGVTGWTDRIFDTTTLQAAKALRSGQRNWLTPSSEVWFAFEPPPNLSMAAAAGGDEADVWLDKAKDITAEALAASNFYSAVNIDYLQVTVFGTSLLFVEEGKDNDLQFKSFKIGTYCIAENDEGIVDTVYREFKMTTRQIRQKWGEQALSDQMQKALKTAKGLDRKWNILHCCFPREDSDRLPAILEGKKDGRYKPWASVYLCLDDKSELSVSGFDEMPYLCSRFDKWGSDAPWGYSPAYETLPVARQLNMVTMNIDALADIKANPRFLIPDNLKSQVDYTPGGATYFDHNHPESKPEEWLTGGDYKTSTDWINGKKDAINRTFYVYVFQMLQQLQDKKMTAYEVSQRLSENLQQFTSVFDRRVTEFLNPLLRRVFGILYRNGKFGDAPPSLRVATAWGPKPKGRQQAMQKTAVALPKITITSRISLGLKALQNQGSQNTLEMLLAIVKIAPQVLDNFDLDVFVRDYARNNGVPPDTLRQLQSMQKLRLRRDQLNKQNIALQQSLTAAKAGQALEKSPEGLKSAALEKLGVEDQQ